MKIPFLFNKATEEQSESVSSLHNLTDLSNPEFLRSILDNLDAAVFVADRENNEILYANKTTYDLFADPEGHICWQTIHDNLDGPWESYPKEDLTRHNGKPKVGACREYYDNKKDTWYDICEQFITWENGKKVLLKIAHDIKNTVDLRQTIEKGKQEWEGAFDIINDAITIHDSDFNIIRANKAAADLLGTSIQQILGKKCFFSYHGTKCAPSNCPSCVTKNTGENTITEIYEPYLGKHIEIKALPRIANNGQFKGIIHVVRDISDKKEGEIEQKKLHTQLVQSQKMEAIGQLAGGVAHDFNNLLTGIQGLVGLALDELTEQSQLREDLLEVEHLSKRAGELTHQLLAFSRRNPGEPTIVKFNELINHLGKMLIRLVGEDVELQFQISDDILYINADAGQIEQIIINLIVNSRQAMDAGGRLTIKTEEVTLQGHERFFATPLVKKGPYVRLKVIDTGHGISEHIKDQIFEPFFTTKDFGKGTGLGLSMIYGLVKEHNGYIAVDSQVNLGTTMSIYFPLIDPEAPTTTYDNSIPEDYKGHGTILLVDDDKYVLNSLERMLKRLGYNFLSANNAFDAEKIYLENIDSIDLLLTDIVMPGKSGEELYTTLKETNPDIKAVFMSGYIADSKALQRVSEKNIPFIEKPISLTKLANIMKREMENISL